MAALVLAAAVAATGSIASASSHRRPGCSRRCRQLGGLGGTEGECSQTASYAGAAVADARTLKIKIDGSFPATGDLVLAAVASDRGGVRPPSGWHTYPNGPSNGAAAQIFYTIVGQRLPESYTFTTASSQHLTGALLDVMGVSARNPIAADAALPEVAASDSVRAQSITPRYGRSLLVFVGNSGAKVKWTAPNGMKPIYLDPFGQQQAGRLGIAIQRWRPPSATGTRTAPISSFTGNAGQLIALHYPQPITCPRVKVLSRHFQPNRHGIMFVKMRCRWTAPCQGAFEGVDLEDHFATPKLAASDFTIPAGRTRSVPIATTRAGFRALKRHRKLALDIFVWAYTSAHQIVVAGEKRANITAPGT